MSLNAITFDHLMQEAIPVLDAWSISRLREAMPPYAILSQV